MTLLLQALYMIPAQLSDKQDHSVQVVGFCSSIKSSYTAKFDCGTYSPRYSSMNGPGNHQCHVNLMIARNCHDYVHAAHTGSEAGKPLPDSAVPQFGSTGAGPNWQQAMASALSSNKSNIKIQ
jgi:hypothetical protein